MKVKGISRDFSRAWRSFSVRQRLTLYGFILISVVAIVTFWWQINEQYLVEVPASGGSWTEGIVGTPRFINPLLAITETDRDLTILIYSGLTRASSSNQFVPDLADSFTISEDKLIYTFKLKSDLEWHDGKPLTADDVIFTIEKAQDPLLKSPRRAAWEGVKATKIDNQTVQFTLKQPYNGFLENTTLGILPAHLWKKIPIETFSYDALNLDPIGSGPYKIKNIAQSNAGSVINYFDLVPFNKSALGKPYINHLRLRFYENDNALMSAYKRGDIDSLSAVSPDIVKPLVGNNTKVITAPLPRVFGIFFNPNQNKIFTRSEVRSALNQAVNKQEIIDKVLFGFGISLATPIPLAAIGQEDPATTSTSLDKARTILENKGWVKGSDGIYQKVIDGKETLRLSFTLATSDATELKAVAEQVEAAWKTLGAEVTIKVFEKGDLSQDVIRPRQYDAVLFGEVVGKNPDPYVFWHSSQRFDPGLNIANYANVAVDKILENLRSITDPTERLTAYEKINTLIAADNPAIFLYSPLFVYIVPTDINNLNLLPITIPADRFTTIAEWYISTDRVWKIFTK